MKQPEIGTILIATDVCEISLGHNGMQLCPVGRLKEQIFNNR